MGEDIEIATMKDHNCVCVCVWREEERVRWGTNKYVAYVSHSSTPGESPASSNLSFAFRRRF